MKKDWQRNAWDAEIEFGRWDFIQLLLGSEGNAVNFGFLPVVTYAIIPRGSFLLIGIIIALCR